MANISYQLDQNATIAKILNGDMPNGVTPDDTVVLISDDVMRIYALLVSGLLLNTIPEDAPTEVVEKRIQVFDSVMECVNHYRAGRLHRLISALNDAMSEFQVDTKIWPNTKMRNNVFSFISDFWIWSDSEKNQLFVIVEVDLDAEQQYPAESVPAGGEVVVD